MLDILAIRVTQDKLVLEDKRTGNLLLLYNWDVAGDEDEAWRALRRMLHALQAQYGEVQIG